MRINSLLLLLEQCPDFYNCSENVIEAKSKNKRKDPERKQAMSKDLSSKPCMCLEGEQGALPVPREGVPLGTALQGSSMRLQNRSLLLVLY